jgi:hypothetical protein
MVGYWKFIVFNFVRFVIQTGWLELRKSPLNPVASHMHITNLTYL